LVAGAFGTLAMDLVWFRRYRGGGGTSSFGDWELSSGLTWESAPAPAHVGRRLVRGMLQIEPGEGQAALYNNVVHWATGIAWAGLYGLVAGSLEGRGRTLLGLPFGAFVWGSSYAMLGPMGLYKPIWQYDLGTLGRDLSAHLAYGVGTALTYELLDLS
jgi:hypothetical protein